MPALKAILATPYVYEENCKYSRRSYYSKKPSAGYGPAHHSKIHSQNVF